MIKILPFVIIIALVVGGLFYWRYQSTKPTLTTPSTVQSEPIEVPKTLPQATTEERVKALEDLVSKLVAQVNNLKPVQPITSDSKLSTAETAVTELKVRVSALEKATPAPVASSKSTVYIPLGSGGGPWGNKDWYSLSEYEISINPDNYPGYTGMSLEVTFRLTEAIGTASVRLYNVTDGTGYSQVDTASTSFTLQSSSSFKIASGTKTYKLQMKSSESKDVYIQSARIKVTF